MRQCTEHTQVDNISVYYYNATSIRGSDKMHDFNAHFTNQDYHVISVSETWLNDSVFDNEILPGMNFNIHRHDRSLDLTDREDGGGVLCAVHCSLPSHRRKDLEVAGVCDILWVQVIVTAKRSILIGTLYIPPWSILSDLASVEESIGKCALQVRPTDNIILMGDFNLGNLKWQSDGNGAAIPRSTDDIGGFRERVLEITSSCGLTQYNMVPTHEDNVLDLVYTSDVDLCVHKSSKATTSTHGAIEFDVKIAMPKREKKSVRNVYNYKKANFNVIIQLLTLVFWGDFNSFQTVNEAFTSFYDILFSVIKDNVPLVKVKVRSYPHWYDHDLIKMIKQKDKARRAFIKAGRIMDSQLYHDFSLLRAKVKKAQLLCYNTFMLLLGEEIKDNPKRFWTHVNSLKKGCSIPEVMFLNNIQVTGYSSVVKAFSLYFKSLFQFSECDNLPYCTYNNAPLFHMPLITAKDVCDQLSSININTACGPDMLSALFLKNCAEVLSLPISRLFNLSIARGEYPDVLKYNNIIPIHKKESKTIVENYRAISIMPVLAKVFEKIVNKSLRLHLKSLLCEQQHGFVPNRSTVTNLTVYSDYISTCLDESNDVHSVYTDFSRAFDSVRHDLLLHKLNRLFGFQGTVLTWFTSYLCGRYQRVVINGLESEWVKVLSGVPQGSILGPSLFLCFINDLPDHINSSECLLFADDAKFYKRILSLTDCILLQLDIDALLQWCDTWKLFINTDKCFFIKFSLKRKEVFNFVYYMRSDIIQRVHHIKDLGVIFTSSFSFNMHIDDVVSKSFRLLGFVKRTLNPFKDSSVILSMYSHLVRTKLEYCSFIWSPTTCGMSDKLERVQKKILNFMCFQLKVNANLSYLEKCKYFNIQPLYIRRNISELVFVNKVFNNKIDCAPIVQAFTFYVPGRALRRRALFAPRARLNVRKQSPLVRAQTSANNVNLDIFDNVCSFKRSARRHFNDFL